MNTASTNTLPPFAARSVSGPFSARPQAWPADTAAGIEARFGLRVTALLNQSAEGAPHDISERLRVAREQAVERARASRKAASTATADTTVVLGRTAGGSAVLGSQGGWWFRLASVLPLVLLVAGFMAIDRWHDHEQVMAAAELDSALLSDDLPPDAYSDPGFVEYLKTERE